MGTRFSESAVKTFSFELKAIQGLIDSFDNSAQLRFDRAMSLFAQPNRRLVVTGVGKSGIIANKFVATLWSMGFPALFVHAAECAHGDFGALASGDILIAISYSGNSDEVLRVALHSRKRGIPVVTITSGLESSLAKHSDEVILLPKVQEACPVNLMPTSSAILLLSVCDAIAVSLAETTGLTTEKFKSNHPGGGLGLMLAETGSKAS